MENVKISQSARKAFASLGGRSGTGESKRRSPEHYRKMVEARLAKQKNKK